MVRLNIPRKTVSVIALTLTLALAGGTGAAAYTLDEIAAVDIDTQDIVLNPLRSIANAVDDSFGYVSNYH